MLDPLLSPVIQIVGLGMAGIAVWHLQGDRRPNARLVVQIVFFAIMTMILVQSGIAPAQFEPAAAGSNLLVAAKTLWWIHLAWAAIGFARLYIHLDGRPREARLVQDLLVAAVYLGVGSAVLSFVFGIAIGTLLATSGVIAIILGLALQSTLGDVFSGLALTLGRPYAIGDWIFLADGTEGRVVENTWRSTQILTPGNNIVVLPNSYLAKVGLTNISRPDETHQMTLKLRLVPTRNPSSIVDSMNEALVGANVIIHEPPPVAALQAISAMAVDIDLYFNVRHIAERIPALNEIINLVYRQCRADGLALALPASASVVATSAMALPGPPNTMRDLLSASPIFSAMGEGELARLETTATVRRYQPGDPLLLPSESVPALQVIRKGVAIMERDGVEQVRLSAEDIIGQVGLENDTVVSRAMTPLDAYAIDGAVLSEIGSTHPTMMRDLSRHISTLAVDASAIGDRKAHQRWHAAAFLRAIQSVFHR